MRRTRRAAALTAAALLALPLAASAGSPAAAALPLDTTTSSSDLLQPWLAEQLATAPATDLLRVALRATSVDAAEAAATGAGLFVQQRWDLVDTVVAVGTPAQVSAAAAAPGVLRLDGDSPLVLTGDETAHQATRSQEALETLTDAEGARYDGTGVTIAVIDSGIDGTHPMFAADPVSGALGATKVVQNRKNACGIVLVRSTNEACFVPAPDTDDPSVGGHGTHVAGIAAGNEITTSSPSARPLRGAAPGATLVGLSVGAALGLVDAMSAQYWVLEHQQNPCRTKAQQTESEVDAACPPIRVTNHSYGPAAGSGDNVFNPNSTAVVLQRQLVEKGVVAVWAAGNDGGDGSQAVTNPTGMDPTPGVLMVASYDDGGTGTRDGELSDFSSRGKKGVPGSYPDISAPGDRITSACRATLLVCSTGLDPYDNGDYNTISGTSMASPYIAGVVATLFDADPALTPADVEDALEDTAHAFTAGGAYEDDPTNDTLTSFDKGHGLVDVVAALTRVTGGTATATANGSSGTAKTKKGGPGKQ